MYFFSFSFSAAFLGFSFALSSSIHFMGNSIYRLLNVDTVYVLNIECPQSAETVMGIWAMSSPVSRAPLSVYQPRK